MGLKNSVLNILDHASSKSGSFIWLNDIYSYLIGCRLNVFRGDDEKWAILLEKIGFNPRVGNVVLSFYCYGNCLKGTDKNYSKEILLIDEQSVDETFDVDILQPEAEYWSVRGKIVRLEHNKEEYLKAGITLNEYEPESICIEEAARFLYVKHTSIFNATEEELTAVIPEGLNKILVLDEWFHKDFNAMDIEELNSSKPSSYETWQLIADIIDKLDPSLYKPSLKPNTHWSNYPDSGTY